MLFHIDHQGKRCIADCASRLKMLLWNRRLWIIFRRPGNIPIHRRIAGRFRQKISLKNNTVLFGTNAALHTAGSE
jgi:hypothetical protein